MFLFSSTQNQFRFGSGVAEVEGGSIENFIAFILLSFLSLLNK
jgi:hypothetical protein